MGSSAEAGSSISRTSGCTATARAMHNRCCWPPDRLMPGRLRSFLTSSHNAAIRKACSMRSRKNVLVAHPVEPQTHRDVLRDRHRGKRVRLLEDHAHAAADHRRVDPRGVEIVPVKPDGARHPRAGHQFVHPVEAAQERRLAAAARSDDGRHRPRRDLQRHPVHGRFLGVVNGDVLRVERRPVVRRRGAEGGGRTATVGLGGAVMAGFGSIVGVPDKEGRAAFIARKITCSSTG